MPLVVKDRVKETTTTTGTGTITLAGAVSGFQSFSVIGNGNTTYYTIQDPTAGTWEVGIGTYTSSGTTLSRDSVLESSNSGNLVNFGAGDKDVFVTYPAERSVYVDGSSITPGATARLGFANLAQGSALSVLGVTGNATADNASIAAGTDHQVLRRSGTAVAFGAVNLAQSAAITGTLPVGNGGTGQTSYTNGQLLIGNTTGNTLTKATLTAGTGISITNGTGSISIDAINNGDVVGPASATDNAVARFDGTTGKLIQNSTVTVDDSGNVAAATVTLTGNVLPAVDNTGVVGNATNTWSNGQFTDLTVDGTLNVRTAIDLADNDILRFGSSDDWEMYHNGTANYMDLTVGDLLIRDDGTAGDPTRFTFERTTGIFTATGESKGAEIVATNGLVLNATTVAESYTIPSGYNAQSVGPMTVNSGVTVTVSSGQRWLVV